MKRHDILFTCEADCDKCDGLGITKRGVVRTFCDCVESEIAPDVLAHEEDQPVELSSVPDE